MLGGYNIQPLIQCLQDDELGDEAAKALSTTSLPQISMLTPKPAIKNNINFHHAQGSIEIGGGGS